MIELVFKILEKCEALPPGELDVSKKETEAESGIKEIKRWKQKAVLFTRRNLKINNEYNFVRLLICIL